MQLTIRTPGRYGVVFDPNAQIQTDHEIPVALPDGNRIWALVRDGKVSDDNTALIYTVEIPDEFLPRDLVNNFPVSWEGDISIATAPTPGVRNPPFSLVESWATPVDLLPSDISHR